MVHEVKLSYRSVDKSEKDDNCIFLFVCDLYYNNYCVDICIYKVIYIA